MVSIDEMIRLVKECQEIINKVQDGNKDRAARERSKGVHVSELPDQRGQRGDEIHH